MPGIVAFVPLITAVVTAILGGKPPPRVEEACTQCSPAIEAVAANVEELDERIGTVADEVDDLRTLVQLAVFLRQPNIHVQADCQSPAQATVGDCESDKCDGATRDASTFDTMGPCVRREALGEIAFDLASPDPRADQKSRIAELAGLVRHELRYVFVVGYADQVDFTAENRRLGEERAKSVVAALKAELAKLKKDGENGPNGETPNRPKITAVSGADWAPPSVCRRNQLGKVHVYLLWHAPSPLCRAGEPVAAL